MSSRRRSSAVALVAISLGIASCGGGSVPPPPPKDEAFCDIVAVPCLLYNLDSNGLPTSCRTVACTDPSDLSTCASRPASAPRNGDRVCFMHAVETPQAACTALCDAASGHLNPNNWPTDHGVRALCTSTLNTDATFHNDLNASGYVPDHCMDPGPNTLPLDSAGTHAIQLSGAGTAVLDGTEAPVSIVGGYFDLAAPNTSCNALQSTCATQLNQVDFADFSFDGHAVTGMRLDLDTPVLTASGVFTANHFLFTIPQAVTFDAVASVDGALTGVFVSSTAEVDGSIDLATGRLAFQFDVTGSFGGKTLEASGLVTTAQVVDVAPVVTAGPVTAVDTSDACTASVTIAGAATSAAGLPVTLSYVVDDRLIGSGPSATLTLPIGNSHSVTIVGIDSLGMRDTANETVTPTDTLGPVITPVTAPITLWPPDHQYVTVSLDQCVVSVVDQCDGSLSPATRGQITRVTSNELAHAPGSGDTCNDIVITSHDTVQLRAERNGPGLGRVYTIHFTETDLHGNTTAASCTVQVPHNQSGGTVIDNAPVLCVGTACGGIPGPSC